MNHAARTLLPFVLFEFILGLNQTAFAKEKECCWIDVKTGQRVPTVPQAGINISGAIDVKSTYDGTSHTADPGVAIISKDGNTATNSRTGQKYNKEPDGCWVDVKTGQRVPTVPQAGINISGVIDVKSTYDGTSHTADPGVAIISKDGNSARNSRTGATYKRVPCPKPPSTSGDCLSKKFPGVQDSHDGKTAFDPQSGRNFAWEKDKQSWIDVKTGECICPCSGNTTTNVRKTHDCLDEKFPGVHHSHDGKTAFDPQSGRNFAWEQDKQAWVDVKTGECICPCAGTSTTETIKKIFQGVSIGIGGGIGGGGGDRHGHHGEGGHRTAEKVRTGDKSRTTSTTSKKTTTGTGHKTVTAACKCHPCTCSPCTCH